MRLEKNSFNSISDNIFDELCRTIELKNSKKSLCFWSGNFSCVPSFDLPVHEHNLKKSGTNKSRLIIKAHETLSSEVYRSPKRSIKALIIFCRNFMLLMMAFSKRKKSSIDLIFSIALGIHCIGDGNRWLIFFICPVCCIESEFDPDSYLSSWCSSYNFKRKWLDPHDWWNNDNFNNENVVQRI